APREACAMDEQLRGLQYLLAALKANSTITAQCLGGVWPWQAPIGTAVPFCVVAPMGGLDRQGIAGTRLFYEGTYAVRFGGLPSDDTLLPLDEAADAALQDTAGNTPDVTAHIMSCLRDMPLVPLSEWVDEAQRIGIGGLYRLQVRKN